MILHSPKPDIYFKLVVTDEISTFLKNVILKEHYLFNPALTLLQSLNQGKDWKDKIEYAVNIECEKLSGCVYRKDKINRRYELLDTDQFTLFYIPKSNCFYFMNFSDSSYPFDFIDVEQSMTA